MKGQENIVADQLSRLCPRAPAGPTPKLIQLAQLGQTNVVMPVITSATEEGEPQGQEDEVEGLANNEHEEDAAGRVSAFVKNEPTRKQ